MKLDLLPPPKRVHRQRGFCDSRRVTVNVGDKLVARREAGAYRLTISGANTQIFANDEAGVCYARQTLRQIDRQFPAARPRLTVSDWPDFPVRGFYHDVSRGKVPTLKTLLALADTCAQYKLNHLELYIEHTYAFKKYPAVWRDADPLTAAEIRALDDYCAARHIDLVPSFSTFGHFYTWMVREFPELNELEVNVSGDPFNFHDRMQHYTLDCQNPRSIKLVEEIIREVRPLFRSIFFNICADETFDLGKGRNRALAERIGVRRLYLDFLKKIMAIVSDCGATPLFWGDVIDPLLMSELPADAVMLEWDYGPRPHLRRAPLFAKSGRPFYLCTGVRGWNNWLPDYPAAHRNITRFARHGQRLGARGLLNTDWGDFGHINTLGPSVPGLVLGASAAWHARSATLTMSRFNAAASRLVLGDLGGKLLGLLSDTVSARRAGWVALCHLFQPRSRDFDEGWFDADGLPVQHGQAGFIHPAREHATALTRIRRLSRRALTVLKKSRPTDPLTVAEIETGLLGLQVMEEYFIFRLARAGRTKIKPLTVTRMTARLLELERRLAAVWRRRNKPSEYFRIREVLTAAARDCRRRLS
ncbi:MAG: beta-N-acetylhexosaminidase [Verrucomicrobiales bacterium]|jgi:hypothetical protein|nr:beta-N-acetylhexosaminidase [Verrucomicrobiales bacterium]